MHQKNKTNIPFHHFLYLRIKSIEKMIKATLRGKTYDVLLENGSPTVDGSKMDWDIAKISENHFHIVHKNKSYSAELISHDKASKTVTLKINGGIQKVELKDRFDVLLEKMGMSGAAAAKLKSIKAPMPGLIVKVNVAVGDVVKPGDPLLVLEAMKMENMIKASAEGKVSQVKIKKGDSVEKGQVLVEF
jgi:biotin carboxyl carrier protein